MRSEENKKKNIVIIGGGFAGTTLAKRLEKLLPDDWNIYLLSQTNFVTFNPLLPEVVGASVLPGHVQAPIRMMIKRTRVRMVTVDRIDVQQNKVLYHNDEPGEIEYDQLVIAAGVGANLSMIPGMFEHSLPLKTVGDAVFIRNTVVERLEQATIHSNLERRKSLTTFIVVGGGFSGVETAGELDDFLKASEKYYKNVERGNCKIILLHGGDCLLPELSTSLGKKTEEIFSLRGIIVKVNARATRFEKEKVILHDGEEIVGATIISTIGTKPHAFIQQNESLPIEKGKIIVEGDMSVSGMTGLWALGDCALVPNAYNQTHSPPTAQFADRQAKHLADNIAAFVKGQSTTVFSFKPAGMLASIGHNKAVAEVYGVKTAGLFGFLLWRAIYLAKMPTLARKVRLFLEWSWAMFFPPDISHLGFKQSELED